MPEKDNILLGISVLLPVYNTKEEYLRECIESILNQTFSNFELLILNDGSTNNVEDVILSYKDSRIKYYKQENLGITSARNKLLTLAKGKYIAIADHDDISTPDRLEKEYKFLESHPTISLVSGSIKILSSNKVWTRKAFPDFLDFVYRCEIIHPACMWRRVDFEKHNLKYDASFFGVQDYALFAEAIKHLKCANLPDILLYYRKHETNASNNKFAMITESERVQKNMLEFLTKNKNLQKKILLLVLNSNTSFVHKIFSIKNYNSYKIFRFFGFKIFLKRLS